MGLGRPCYSLTVGLTAKLMCYLMGSVVSMGHPATGFEIRCERLSTWSEDRGEGRDVV